MLIPFRSELQAGSCSLIAFNMQFSILRYLLTFILCLGILSLQIVRAEVGDGCLPTQGRYVPTVNELNFRTGPGAKYSKVVNEKFTQLTGRTDYRVLDKSYVIRAICKKDGWLNGEIVEAGGSDVRWETGWVKKSYLKPEPAGGIKIVIDFDSFEKLTSSEKKILQAGAEKAVRDDKNCDVVINGYRSASKKGMYFVTCQSPEEEVYNVFFSKADVESVNLIKRPNPYPESRAFEKCYSKIRSGLKRPSTLDIHTFSVRNYITQEHGRQYIIPFDAKNAFNAELEFTAWCLVHPDGDITLNIKPR